MPDIILVKISKLTLLENNPRKINKEQFAKLCKSLQDDPDFFSNRPCLVHLVEDKYSVYAGNQRVQAAKKLGWKEVPCIIETGLSQEVIKERIIKDNKHYGEFDFDILANEFDIETLLDAGFYENELIGNVDVEEIEYEEKEEKKPTCKLCPQCGFDLNG